MRAFLIILFSCPLLAQVHTSINDVYYRSSAAFCGSAAWDITSDFYATASPEEPIYIRLTMNYGATLSETLVLQSSSNSEINQPINLAMRVDDPAGVYVPIAAPDAIRIVRWVAGESHIWIEIRQSSDSWLEVFGSPTGPSISAPVSWDLGTSARQSDTNHEADAATSPSNLPFNTRDVLANEGDFADAVSTLLCLDLSESTVLPDGTPNALIDFREQHFDHQSDQGNGEYAPINPIGISFIDEYIVGRAKDRDCNFSSITPTSSVAFRASNGLPALTQHATTNLSCLMGGNFLTGTLYPGAHFILRVNAPKAGFPANGAVLTDWAHQVFETPGSAITIDGVLVYRELVIYYDDVPRTLAGEEVNFSFELQYDATGGTNIPVSLEVALPSHEGGEDEAPYAGDDQARRCSPIVYRPDPQEISVEVPVPGSCMSGWPLTYSVLYLVEQGYPCHPLH